jgi:hypothetical protein
MAQPIRVVTAEQVSRDMESAPPLTDLDLSMVETVLSYVEGDDLDAAKTYVAAMSTDGLGRALRNLTRAATLMAVALVRKRMLRDPGERRIGTDGEE